MSEHPKVLIRCPVCFSHENDVVLMWDGEFYCIKCGFVGSEAVVRDMYDDLRKKYRLLHTRVTMEALRDL